MKCEMIAAASKKSAAEIRSQLKSFSTHAFSSISIHKETQEQESFHFKNSWEKKLALINLLLPIVFQTSKSI